MCTFDHREREHEGIRNLVDRPHFFGTILLDAGARDGSISRRLAEHFDVVIAVDQKKPNVSHARVAVVQGDITALAFPDRYFDCVICTEVLEHIPPPLLLKACAELERVAARNLVIRVRYRQDLRVSRTTCYTCGGKIPPCGHVNAFDEQRLLSLFAGMEAHEIVYVGTTTATTNVVATFLMDVAGNPYGTYTQENACIHCGARLKTPPPRSLLQKACTRVAFHLNQAQARFARPRPNWIHVLFQRSSATTRPVPSPPRRLIAR